LYRQQENKEKGSAMAKGISMDRMVVWLPRVYLALRLGLAILFIYGGISKLIDPKAFAGVLSKYDLVPEVLLPVVAVGLPLLETLAGIGLALDVRGSLTVITALLGLFVVVLWYGVLNGLMVDCGCFGAGEAAGLDSLKGAFYRDLVLLGVAAFLFFARRAGPCVRAPVWKNKIRRRMENGTES
jgi:uncharacterized membrane protein YphA (DoxX/SURF4 family)